MFLNRRIIVRTLLTITLLAAYPVLTKAADDYWNATSGDWSNTNPIPWSLGKEPTTSDNAYIQNGGTATISQTGEQCFNLYLGATGVGSSGTIEMTGGSLAISNIFDVGHNGTGTFTQTGGINSISSKYAVMNVGGSTGGNGTYFLSGSGQLFATNEYVGYHGLGTFTQISGTNTITSSLALGYVSGSTGTYILSDTGQLSVINEYIGYSGIGTFTQTGGTNSISSGLQLGVISGSTGTYILNGAANLSADSEYIGNFGTGVFTQSSGTNTITKYLYLGCNSDSSGEYKLSDSGQLSAKNEYVGESGMGIFSQTGGINTANYIKIGTNGTLTLAGGILNINGGIENQGILDLSNSSAIINATASIIDLSNVIHTGAGKPSINLDSNSLLIVPIGFDSANYFKNYTNTGILHESGSTLEISSAYNIYGAGSINDHVKCQGTLTTPSGYSINLNGGLTITDAGIVNLGNGKLYINDLLSEMSGVSLNAYYQYIGSTGNGTFTQTGGTNTISNILYVGYNAGYSGIYNLSGGINSASAIYLGYNSGSCGTYNLSGSGQLSIGNEYIGYSGMGTFTQNGGINTVRYMNIAANGTYTLSAGTLNISGGIENQGILDLSNSSAIINATASIIDFSNVIHTGAGKPSINLDSNSLLIVPIGFDSANYFKNYSNSGLLYYIGSDLNIPSSYSIAGIGSINDHVYCQGTLSATPTYSINLKSGLTILGSGSVKLQNGSLYINDSNSGMYGGSLMTSNQYVGSPGTGKFEQTGGTNSSGNIYLGNNSGSIGTYDISGGDISGPTSLYLGYNSGSNGTCNLSGTGQLHSVNLYIGYSGTGTFTQTGGTNSPNFCYLGYNSGSSGTYILSDNGKLSSSTSGVCIGYNGTGIFTQTGGTNSSPAALFLGYNSGANGSYTLSGSGSLSSNGECIGYSGTGTFTQTGGTNTLGSSPIYLGLNSGATGTYYLRGTGNLSASGNSEYVGYSGTGTFNQSGGTNSISGYLYLGYNSGANGTYNLSDTGILSKVYDEYIGYFGTGTFNQTGGTNTTSALHLGLSSNASGTYILNGGTLITKFIYAGSGNNTFKFGGGTLQASGDSGTMMPMILTGDGGNANVNTAGYNFPLAGILSGLGGLNKLGSGTLSLEGSNSYSGNTCINAGKLSLTSTGSISSSPIIDILSGATFDVSAKNSGNGGFTLCGAQTLMGSGTVIGNLVAAQGSHIAPGNSAGMLTLSGNLTLNDGALLDFELGDVPSSDKISMSSRTLYLNYQDFSDFNFTALTGFGNGIYTLIDAGTISGNLGDKLTGTIGNFSATLSKSGNDLILTVVPEPGTWALLATACLALFIGKVMGKK
jgi:T5SS/PEP-CTERM-associated repeat protein